MATLNKMIVDLEKITGNITCVVEHDSRIVERAIQCIERLAVSGVRGEITTSMLRQAGQIKDLIQVHIRIGD